MTISTTKKLLGATVAAGVIFALAGCGQAPADEAGGSEKPVDSDFLPCLISDAGGWNDKSFNQSAKEGMDSAAEELGIKPLEFESANDNDYAPNLETAVSEGCSLIVSVGFKLSAATVESALANPELDYAIIDDWADNDFDGEVDAPNIKPLVFDTAQAAYLGGYAAAAWSAQSGVNKVGTFGGMQIRRSPCSWTATSSVSRSTTRTSRLRSRSSDGMRRRRRAPSRVASTRTTPPSRPLRACSTRAST